MAAGSAFSLVPNVVVTEDPEYHNIITQSDSMKKEYMNIAASPTRRYTLSFKTLSSTDMDILLTHYNDQYGGYHSFSWQSVPDYISSGSNKTGRWVDKSLKISPIVDTYWKCNIVFEENI